MYLRWIKNIGHRNVGNMSKKSINILVITLLFGASTSINAHEIGEKISTYDSTGNKIAEFRRVSYKGFKNQSSAWMDPKGIYWSDTLPGTYRNCLRPVKAGDIFEQYGKILTYDGHQDVSYACKIDYVPNADGSITVKYYGDSPLYSGVIEKDLKAITIQSEAIEACKLMGTSPENNVRLPSMSELESFLNNFDRTYWPSNLALARHSLEELKMFRDKNGNYDLIGKKFWSIDNANNHYEFNGRLYSGSAIAVKQLWIGYPNLNSEYGPTSDGSDPRGFDASVRCVGK